jgi:hypothetical protein
MAELSRLAPGTALKPHTGPTNTRLRIHLPLIVPDFGAARDADADAGADAEAGPVRLGGGTLPADGGGRSMGGALSECTDSSGTMHPSQHSPKESCAGPGRTPSVRSRSGLLVGGEVRQWVAGHCLVFDDSFVHSAWHDSVAPPSASSIPPNHQTKHAQDHNQARHVRDRIVLLVDIWHPGLASWQDRLDATHIASRRSRLVKLAAAAGVVLDESGGRGENADAAGSGSSTHRTRGAAGASAHLHSPDEFDPTPTAPVI